MKVETSRFQESHHIQNHLGSFDGCKYDFSPLLLAFCSSKDFGEYQESYYSVQTTEGEQISQLIAGYIDIILKKASGVTRLAKAAWTALKTAAAPPSAEAEQRSLWPGGGRGVHHAGGVGFSQEVSQIVIHLNHESSIQQHIPAFSDEFKFPRLITHVMTFLLSSLKEAVKDLTATCYFQCFINKKLIHPHDEIIKWHKHLEVKMLSDYQH